MKNSNLENTVPLDKAGAQDPAEMLSLLLADAQTRNPGIPLLTAKDSLSAVLTELQVLRGKVTTGMKPRADDGPISGEAIARRMGEICGCRGKFDCDCVSVENLARRGLWTEHNQAQRDVVAF